MSRIGFKELVQLADRNKMAGELLESFYFACRTKNLTTSTLDGYAERLSYLVRYGQEINKDIDEITYKDLQRYVLSIVDKVSSATVNGRIRVYRLFFKHLLEEGLIDENPASRLNLIKQEKKIKPVLSAEEMGLILSKINRRSFHGARNYCMILLTYDSMLRLNELLSIKLDEINLAEKIVKIHGKGRKDRFVPFSDKTARSLHTYLIKFRKGINFDYLFPMQNGEKIKYRRAHNIFAQSGKKVGLYVYPHLVRHSAASQFARSGGSIAILQKVLGHSSLTVTQRYVHLSTEDMQAAYDRFSPAGCL
ncbi:MAG: tyrosine-type recombinase/integrase [Candidatus Zixiibacteriota bacterium]